MADEIDKAFDRWRAGAKPELNDGFYLDKLQREFGTQRSSDYKEMLAGNKPKK